MIDMETLVVRLMDLETKYYELQDKYHQLINQYEKLKDEHEPQHSEEWKSLTYDEIHYAINHFLGIATTENLHKMVRNLENKLREKNEGCAGHRNEHGERYDPWRKS